ncbi:MAG: family 16 glycosylhydrolase [Woeseiaceae bacterium]
MKFRSQASLLLAASLAALLVFSACSDNRSAPLSAVQTIDIPAADPGAQANQNISNPVLTIPQTFPVGDGDQLTLVWSEEFNGPEIDPEVWFFATGDGTEKGLPGGWGNNELQYYLPDNAMIVNGVLEITARRETVGNLNYTSARINTEDRFAFKYGRIEARIKMPSGQGLWPAFWMLSQDSDYVCGVDNQGNDRPCVWAATGEIDIVEAINLDGTNGNEIFATIHYGGEFPANQSTSVTYTPSVDVTESFNTYAIEWDEDEIRWYFNGLLYAVQDSWNSAALNGGPSAPFDQNFHILLNLAVGGNFPGSPNGTTPFPATMQVDWVRVYSGEDPSGSAATEPNVSAPTPTEDPAGVISLFSDAYTDIAGIDYNPNWNQATVVTQAQIAGNKMLKYAGLNYQGMDFAGNPQDVSDKGYLHLDFWTADSTALNVYLISPGSETPYALPVTPNSWVSVDVLLTEFAGVDLANVIQLKFDGNGTIFLDNLYFGGEAPPPVTATGGTVPGATILEADGSTADLTSTFTGFSSGTGTAIVADSSYSNALEVTVADGYAPGVLNLAQLFITGLSSLDSYDEFLFKVKGLTDNNLLLKIEPPAGTTVAIDLTAPGAGITVEDLGDGWFQVVVSLAPFGDLSGANQVILQTLDNAYALGDTFLLTDIGFNTAGGGGGGEIAVNGGFENGDLSNWALFPANASDPNEQTVVTTNPKTGTYAGRINNTTPASASIIKQANLTPVSIGQTATITFSARGSFGTGGVAFAEFFTEISGGGTSSSQILGGGPLTLDADPNVWSDFSFVIPITTDVSGGVTLQLTGTTGGDAASFADVYYDDISIVITD